MATQAERSAKWYERNKVRMLEDSRARYANDAEFQAAKKATALKNGAKWSRQSTMTAKGRARRLWNVQQSRCKREGIEFSLTLDHVLKGIERGACPKTNALFDLYVPEVGVKRRGPRVSPFAPSIDRIDPNKGYTNENVQIVAWWYNSAKGQISELELQQWCRQVLRTAGLR